MAEMTLERLYQNFELLQDWQDRYRFIIKLGEKIERLSDEEHTEENRVHGCMSRVHMVVERDSEEPSIIRFRADSDASIVNGLIAVLQIVYSGKSIAEISQISIEDIFKKLGLESHLSPTRRNGFFSMVARLKNLSSEFSSEL